MVGRAVGDRARNPADTEVVGKWPGSGREVVGLVAEGSAPTRPRSDRVGRPWGRTVTLGCAVRMLGFRDPAE